MNREFNLEIDEKEDKVKLTTVADITDILIENKLERVLNNGFTKQKTMRKIASIPIDVFLALGEVGYEILNDNKKLKEFIMQHPEFRTSEGKI